ncbi:hypothetical protein BDK51DRAFT_49771 [Blyttiomyces helicus]|uniref:Uncharacterized protein n=1 Tax=Blyttiomyces helicus TaxID=388810 RepID=A0A4P9W2A9_9FUNG|nr:hypothetical protein BDK51DRAFT_49771 [Blyttiomyces helicus]|eukprot:RKO84216.1 hypothetical protein BDK51DRAFT_49771 [Blyttiomyces helicus]
MAGEETHCSSTLASCAGAHQCRRHSIFESPEHPLETGHWSDVVNEAVYLNNSPLFAAPSPPPMPPLTHALIGHPPRWWKIYKPWSCTAQEANESAEDDCSFGRGPQELEFRPLGLGLPEVDLDSDGFEWIEGAHESFWSARVEEWEGGFGFVAKGGPHPENKTNSRGPVPIAFSFSSNPPGRTHFFYFARIAPEVRSLSPLRSTRQAVSVTTRPRAGAGRMAGALAWRVRPVRVSQSFPKGTPILHGELHPSKTPTPRMNPKSFVADVGGDSVRLNHGSEDRCVHVNSSNSTRHPAHPCAPPQRVTKASSDKRLSSDSEYPPAFGGGGVANEGQECREGVAGGRWAGGEIVNVEGDDGGGGYAGGGEQGQEV